MSHNESRPARWYALLSFFMLLLWTPTLARPAVAANCGCERELRTKLAEQVNYYDNDGAALIPTLLALGDTYDLPMGVEKVTADALARPITVKLAKGPLSKVFDLCIEQLPGYSWAVRDGVIHVFGAEELTQPTNLFNLLVPFFEVRNQTLDAAKSQLRMSVELSRKRTAGIVGSDLGSMEFEGRRISFTARNATVREILNDLVRLYGNSVWIARVSPEHLSQDPQAGFWQIVPHSVHDPTGLLEPIQEQHSAP